MGWLLSTYTEYGSTPKASLKCMLEKSIISCSCPIFRTLLLPTEFCTLLVHDSGHLWTQFFEVDIPEGQISERQWQTHFHSAEASAKFVFLVCWHTPNLPCCCIPIHIIRCISKSKNISELHKITSQASQGGGSDTVTYIDLSLWNAIIAAGMHFV